MIIDNLYKAGPLGKEHSLDSQGNWVDPATGEIIKKHQSRFAGSQRIHATPAQNNNQSEGVNNSKSNRFQELVNYLRGNVFAHLATEGAAQARLETIAPHADLVAVQLPDGSQIRGVTIQPETSYKLEVSSKPGGRAEAFLNIPQSPNSVSKSFEV